MFHPQIMEGLRTTLILTVSMTMIAVTHEIGFARSVADEVVFMADGGLVEKGPPSQVIDAHLHESTRTFISSIL
jgi:polar amino acid transport system ATP-binding protein